MVSSLVLKYVINLLKSNKIDQKWNYPKPQTGFLKKLLEVQIKKEQIFLTYKRTMPRILKVYASKQLKLRSDSKDDQH